MDELVKQRSELAARVARDQSELRGAMEELRTTLRRRLSLRDQMATRPMPWLVGSFCVGLFLGLRR